MPIGTLGMLAAGAGIKAGISGIQAWSSRRWNKKMWEKQNQYNTPGRQMDRFRRAGLNPNLIYSQGNAGNATAQAGGAQASAPDSDVPAAYLKTAQKGLIATQEGLISEQTKTQQHDQVLKDAQAIAALAQAGMNEAKAQEIVTLLKGRTNLIDSQIGKTDAEAKNIATQEQLAKTGIDLNKARTALTRQEINLKEVVTEIEQIKKEYMDEHPGMTLSDRTLMKLLMEFANITVDSLGKIDLKELDIKYTQWLKKEHPFIYNMLMPKNQRVPVFGQQWDEKLPPIKIRQ